MHPVWVKYDHPGETDWLDMYLICTQDDLEHRLDHRPPIALAQPWSPTVPLAYDLEAAKQEGPLVAGQDPAALGQGQPDQEIRTRRHSQVGLFDLLGIY